MGLINLLSIARSALTTHQAAIETTGARGGVAISMNPHTGDLLALAEAPTFDPNHFRKLRYHETRSRAFLDASDPGSAMKAFLTAIALENDTVTPDDRFDCENGSFRVPGSVIHDSHRGLFSRLRSRPRSLPALVERNREEIHWSAFERQRISFEIG